VNVSVHGITEENVKGAPTWPGAYENIRARLAGRIVVAHTHFDASALSQTAAKYKLPPIECTWLDTAKVARRAWPEFSQSGYGLKHVARGLGIDFKHHDAAEDARAAGEILLRAIQDTGISLNDWLKLVRRPMGAISTAMGGNPEGPLHGEVIVFTGALAITRAEAARLAAAAGCEVSPGVNHNVTLLVVGDQDIRALAGHEKSNKHRKAEDLISKGQPIRILRETDFKFLLGNS
jgi:DNA polymerase-3 subunit epsilon